MVALLLALACTDKADDTATTSAVSFSTDLQFVFDRNCAYTGCHFPPDPVEGMDLTADASYAAIVGVPSAQVPTMNRIEPGDPEASYLILKLEDRQAEVGGTGTRMPTELFLAEPEIDMFKSWILAGAPDN